MSPTHQSMGTANEIEPRHIVAIQLKILTPVGTAIRNDMIEKKGSDTAPVVNMWCAQTVIEYAAMRTRLRTIARYPNSGLRAKTGTTSDTMPNAGSATM